VPPDLENTTTTIESILSANASEEQKEQPQLRKKHNRQQRLKKPCVCKRTYGWHEVVRPKRHSTKLIIDKDGKLIFPKTKVKNVTESRPSQFSNSLRYLHVTIKTVSEIMPFVLNRYPSLLMPHLDRYAKALMTMVKLCRPYIDERFQRDWLSWLLIAIHASAYGHHAAASKNAIEVRASNGKVKRIKLYPEYIRENLGVIDGLPRDIITYIPAYTEFLEVWNLIVNKDNVVREEFVKRFEENKKNPSATSSTHDSIYTASAATTTATTRHDVISENNKDHSVSYDYEYHYISHYDPDLYKRNKKSQGKVRCGRFTESEISSFF
jgi:hypothetical protein